MCGSSPLLFGSQGSRRGQAALKSVNLGDDADTTGAVCGQLAGAYWGVAGIPPEWLEGLAQRDELERAVGALQASCR